MNKRFLAGLLLAAAWLLQGCVAMPVKIDELVFEGAHKVKLPIQGQVIVDMSPDDRKKVLAVSRWNFNEGEYLHNAALKVLGRLFRDVYGSEHTNQGNLVVTVSGNGHVDIFWGTYTANATAHVKLPDGTNIGRFSAEGSESSAMINDTTALENAYIQAFRKIGEQMLAHPVLAGLAAKDMGAPVVVAVPLMGGSRAAAVPQQLAQTAWMPAQESSRTPMAEFRPEPAARPASASAAAPPQSDKKVALVIGNAAYKDAPLKNPVNDARALSAKLRSVGFDVILGENLGQRDMTRLVTRFGEKLAGKGVGLFFYAGHGMQVKGRNYLLPVDAQISNEASARSESLDLDQILDHMSASGSQFNLVVLDACRNNPFERRFRSGGGGGLAQIDAPKGTLIAFATAPGKVAMDGDGENSTYTAALLRALSEPGLPVENVFKRVRGEVSRITGDQQVPWESSSLTGDFYFLPTAAPAAKPAEAKASDTELLFWQTIKESSDAEDFNAYLKRYPDGQFADIARNRVKKLGAK
ncbi:MAG: caspase domain-containing protein [Rhodocyclaceae bacterium]|nr:caspase domain-containing protein [Rhodocyclaceae bacterium]